MSPEPAAPANGKSQRDIFLKAIACADQGQQDTLLDAECGVGTPLRAAVESLLVESSSLGDFLERPAVDDTRNTSSGSPLRELLEGENNLGDEIGPYRLVDIIGEGGGGTVYLAEQSVPVRRTVALKILKPGMDTRIVIARFELERQTLAIMEHPNIARVLDAGATRQGRPYFVMDYVSGAPITEYCDANRLTIDQRLSIFIKVCRAIEHAHQKGIVHRDLKPSNILVTEQEGEFVPKIIDFGVAKAIDPASPGSELTQVETVIGTPAYMSPEQIQRDPEGIDTRSDIYSLGVLLHELLTGFTPVSSLDIDRSNMVEVRRAITSLRPERPSNRLRNHPADSHPAISYDRSVSIHRLVNSLRGDLDWVIMKCLEHDRERRYGSATDLAHDLERFLEGETVMARPPSAAYRIGKFVGRNRTAVTAACGLFLLLMAAAGISTALAIRASRAEEEMREAHRQQSALRVEAVRDRERALRNAETARVHEYVADINVSNAALSDGNIAKALHLLDRQSITSPEERDLRGFEWRFLAGQCLGDQHQSLPTMERPIEALAFSGDGDLLGVGTSARGLIWSLPDARPLVNLPGGISAIAFFPDGDRFATAGTDGVVIHSISSVLPPRILTARGRTIALSPDGRYLASAGPGGAFLWDTERWNRIRPLSDATAPLAFSPDSKTLATGTRDGIKVWSIIDQGQRISLEESPASDRRTLPGGSRLTFSKDGQFILSPQNLNPTSFGYVLGVWNAATGQEVAHIPADAGDGAHAGLISALALNPSGELLATSSWDHSLRIWDFNTRRLLRKLHGHRSEVWCTAFSPPGDLIASGSKNGEIKIWPIEPAASENWIEGRWKPLRFSDDGNYLAAHDRIGTLVIFNTRSREAVHTIELPSMDSRFQRHAISLSKDLNFLAQVQADGAVNIRNLESKAERTLKPESNRIDSVTLSPSADSIVTTSWRDEVTWWDLDNPEEPIATVPGSVAEFSEDGSTLVTLDRNGRARIWNTSTRDERATIVHGNPSYGSRLAVSPDGAVLAMTHGYDDFENAISLWDTFTGERLGILTGHKQGILSLAFSPDGRTLASSSGGGTLRLWNLESQRELITLREPETNFAHLLFSPDGQFLVGGSPPFTARGRLRIFHAPPYGELRRNATAEDPLDPTANP